MSEAYVTLATNDEYALGALTLAMSLKQSGTQKNLVIMITDTVSETMRNVLSQVFNHIEMVNVLDSNDIINLGLLERPELGITFTKLHCWRLVQYSKCVFMDADTLVIQNIDDLFEREELSAAPDPGWPDCFNSGLFVYKPSIDTYVELLQFAIDKGSFDGGDQGLLNMFFSEWPTKDIKYHLPFVYNCVSQAFYSYLPAYTHFRADIKVLHFIGPHKPWHHTFDSATGTVVFQDGSGQNYESLQLWWSTFIAYSKPLLHDEMEGVCGRMASLDVSSFVPHEGKFSPKSHQQAWEHGIIDYRGLDRFENIKMHLDSKLAGKKK